MTLPSPVAYIIYSNEATPLVLAPGQGYGYVLAGNGLFKYARSSLIEALIPLQAHPVAGLPTLVPYARLRGNLRLPGDLLVTVLADARQVASERAQEAMYHFYLQNREVFLRKPRQHTTAGHVLYQGGSAPEIVLDLHSHHEMGASYSGTDNRDEGGFRFYAVIGRIHTRPELRLRIGIYGDHWELHPSTLFSSLGPFQLPACPRPATRTHANAQEELSHDA